jgi:hypothetical protein
MAFTLETLTLLLMPNGKMETDYEKYILDFARLAQNEKWNFLLVQSWEIQLQSVRNIGRN